MKSIIVFSTLFVACFGSGIILPATISRQVHAQGPLGQYHYGYSDGLSAKEEVRSFDGTTRGSYSYVDPNGKLQTVDYVADQLHGFRVAGTNLPKAEDKKLIAPLPVKETPEVMKAKEEHLKIVDAAKRGIVITPAKDSTLLKLPTPVVDTPEVTRAKIEHFAAKNEAQLRNLGLRRDVIVDPSFLASGIRPVGLNAFSRFAPYTPFSSFAPFTPYGSLHDLRYEHSPFYHF